MAKPSTIPQEINQFRPGACTEIKHINGKYYVYMYTSVKLSSGKWGKKTGKCIGKIIPGVGFVSNKNYHLFKNEESIDDITILEYGQYALVDSIASDILELLKKHFSDDKAYMIFAYAIILYVNDFVHLDQVKTFFDQSWLSQKYKKYNLKMGKTALGNLLDELGRRTGRPTAYENEFIEKSTSEIAIDGHAIRSFSKENDLAEAGYKYLSIKGEQVNLLMGYDINSGMPLFSKMFRGACNDKSTIKELSEILKFKDILFVIDRGFYSAPNLQIFSSNGNSYIIPVPGHLNIFKKVMKELEYTDSFYYRSNDKHSRIEYMKKEIGDVNNKSFIYVFRDIEENEKTRFNYLRSIDLEKAGYTKEKFEQNKELFGVYVLQTNSDLSAEEVFDHYKKRWGIETFYKYVKNIADFNNLMIQDYYKENGFAFMILIVGQIHQKIITAAKVLKTNTISEFDILSMARFIKMRRRGKVWNPENMRKRELDMLRQLGFVPETSVPD